MKTTSSNMTMKVALRAAKALAFCAVVTNLAGCADSGASVQTSTAVNLPTLAIRSEGRMERVQHQREEAGYRPALDETPVKCTVQGDIVTVLGQTVGGSAKQLAAFHLPENTTSCSWKITSDRQVEFTLRFANKNGATVCWPTMEAWTLLYKSSKGDKDLFEEEFARGEIK